MLPPSDCAMKRNASVKTREVYFVMVQFEWLSRCLQFSYSLKMGLCWRGFDKNVSVCLVCITYRQNCFRWIQKCQKISNTVLIKRDLKCRVVRKNLHQMEISALLSVLICCWLLLPVLEGYICCMIELINGTCNFLLLHNDIMIIK